MVTPGIGSESFMGTLKRPYRVKLISGLLFGEMPAFEKARSRLERLFGRIDYESPTIDFTHTEYYGREMGDNLKRKFLSFEKLVSLDGAFRTKLKTNDLERRLAVRGKRTVNIDPGYIDLSKLVLFSTKDFSHRIYVGGGIFAEVTLHYKDKRFNPWPWTYPDYQTAPYNEIFNSIRDRYKAERVDD